MVSKVPAVKEARCKYVLPTALQITMDEKESRKEVLYGQISCGACCLHRHVVPSPRGTSTLHQRYFISTSSHMTSGAR